MVHDAHVKVTNENKRLTISNTVTWCNYKVSFQFSFQLNYNSKGDHTTAIKMVELPDLSLLNKNLSFSFVCTRAIYMHHAEYGYNYPNVLLHLTHQIKNTFYKIIQN